MSDFDQPAILAVFDALMSVPMGSGLFDAVNGGEPMSAPGIGVSCALWLDTIEPDPTRSGQASISLVCTFRYRIFRGAFGPAVDQVEPEVMVATVAMMAAIAGDFDLNGTAAAVDLLGMASSGLGAQAGYLTQDGKFLRVMDIVIPVLINDAFAEVP